MLQKLGIKNQFGTTKKKKYALIYTLIRVINCSMSGNQYFNYLVYKQYMYYTTGRNCDTWD